MENTNKITILLGATFHHLGFAVSSIDENLKKIYDPIQRVTVAFVDMNGVKVELIKPEGEDSPAKNFMGKGVYHLSFEAQDLEKCIEHAEENGFKCISAPVPAKAFNGRKIAWLISSKYGLIEVLQK